MAYGYHSSHWEYPPEESDGFSSTGESEDATFSATTKAGPDSGYGLKKKLLSYLNGVNVSGTFSSYHQTDSFVNPGLTINGYGTIPFPLQRRDAEKITQMSRQAPFGKGDQTVVDTEVRRTWELDRASFDCRNPAWASYLEKLVVQAASELGIGGTVNAESYKLLLYEEGAFFKAHKDTEKVPGMIATLVICLPSKHEGGEVHLSHSGQRRVFQTAPSSEYGLSVLAWYSDVTHEIMPVTSGHRLVLTYNLVQKTRNALIQSASALTDQATRLAHLLHKWTQEYPKTKRLLYILEHKYTQSSLQLASLKGRDKAIGDHIYQICHSEGFYFFLATLEKTSCEDEYDAGNDEDSISLRNIVLPSGLQIARNVDIEDNEILQQNPFNRDPDSEEDGEFTGNENAPPTLRYHNTVAVLIPKYWFFTLFSSQFNDFNESEHLLNFVCQDAQSQPHDSLAQKTAIQFLKKCLTLPRPAYSFGTDVTLLLQPVIAQWALTLGHHHLFQKVIGSGFSASNGFTEEMSRCIADLVGNHYINDLPEWDDLLGNISFGVSKLSTINDSFTALENYLPTDPLRLSLKKWKLEKLDKLLDSRKILEGAEKTALLDLIDYRNSEWFTNRAYYSLLNILYYKKSANFYENLIENAFRHILENTALKLVPKDSDFVQQPQYYQVIQPKEQHYTSQFIILIDLSLALNLNEVVISFLQMAAGDISSRTADVEFDPAKVSNFLSSLITTARKYFDSAPQPEIKLFVEVLLYRVNITFFSKRPIPPRSWSQQRRGCGCVDCKMLDKFLFDAKETVGRFPLAQKRRDHLEYQLGYNDFFKKSVDKSKSPHTLIVIKTRLEYETTAKKWGTMLESWRSQLKCLQNAYMQSLLGDQYEQLILFQEAPRQTSQRPLESRSSNNKQPSQPAGTAGTKRKAEAEVIDLTEEPGSSVKHAR